MAMTTQEVGVYCLLLFQAWIDGGIPTDHAELARRVRLSLPRFEKAWRAVGPCWGGPVNGLFVNGRQERERRFQTTNRERLQALSKKGNLARWKADSGSHAGTEWDPKPSAPVPEAQRPYPKPKAQSPKPVLDVERASGARVEIEAWSKVFAEFPTLDTPDCHAAYRDLVAMRKHKRFGEWRPDTLRANLRDAAPHGPVALAAAFRESTRSEYRGVFPDKHKPRRAPTNPTGAPTLGQMLDAHRNGGAA